MGVVCPRLEDPGLFLRLELLCWLPTPHLECCAPSLVFPSLNGGAHAHCSGGAGLGSFVFAFCRRRLLLWYACGALRKAHEGPTACAQRFTAIVNPCKRLDTVGLRNKYSCEQLLGPRDRRKARESLYNSAQVDVCMFSAPL